MRDLADELLQAKVKARLFGGDHAPRLGRLVILDKIGAGGMGTVYSAYDPRLDRKVAVKVMHAVDPAANARLLRECRALAKLAHPNIIGVFDAGDETGAVHVVMELASGVPLRTWIDAPDRTWRDVVRVLAEVAAGLAAAHRAGLVHRDVKPDNILVGDRARLVDFGLALDPARTDAPSTVGVTIPGSQRGKKAAEIAATELLTDDHGAGTPSYMAPEVLAGGRATPASDQFSFGVTLYEALYGERPYAGTTRGELRDAALRAADAVRKRSTLSSRSPKSVKPESAEPPPTTRRPRERPPAWVDAIVRRTLAPIAAERFANLDEVATELSRDRRRRRRLALAVAAALVVGAGIGALAYRARGGPSEVVEVVSCDGASRVDAVWNPKEAERVRARLGDVPWATTTVDAMGRAAATWNASFRTVCEATRVRGEQSDRLLELRMRCLDRVLDRIGALTEAMESPLEATERAEAPSSVTLLPQSERCLTLTDPAELALPADPKQRADIIEIERELDHAWAAYMLGRYRAAHTRSTALLERSQKIDHPPLNAAVLVIAAAIEGRAGESHKAREMLDRAAVIAAKARAPELELAVWERRLREELWAGHFDRVIEWAATGEAAAARAGLEGGEIAAIVGDAYRLSGKLGLARDKLEKALASRDRIREDQRAMIEMNLGSIDLALGKSTAAELHYQRAYDRAHRALGDDHPTLAIHLDRLAEVARARGRIKEALEIHDRSITLRRKAFGEEDRSNATAHMHRAETLLEAGRIDEALAEAITARTIRIKALGKYSGRVAEIEALIGDIAVARGQLVEARDAYTRAHDIVEDYDDDRRLAGAAIASPVLFSGKPPPGGPFDPAVLLPLARGVGIAMPLDVKRIATDAGKLEPFSVERITTIAPKLALLPRDRAQPLVAALLARYRAAGPVDAALSIAVADLLLATGDRTNAAAIYAQAIAATAEEPSRMRLHAYRGMLLALPADESTTARAAADALAAAMLQLGAKK